MRAILLISSLLASGGTIAAFVRMKAMSDQLKDLRTELHQRDESSGGEGPGGAVRCTPLLVPRPADPNEVAALVVAQLRPALAAGAAAAPPDAPPAPPVLTPEQQETHRRALRDASAIVDDALRRGRMEMNDVIAIRQLRAKVNGGGREFNELRARIAAAINRDELTPPEDHHFILP